MSVFPVGNTPPSHSDPSRRRMGKDMFAVMLKSVVQELTGEVKAISSRRSISSPKPSPPEIEVDVIVRSLSFGLEDLTDYYDKFNEILDQKQQILLSLGLENLTDYFNRFNEILDRQQQLVNTLLRSP